MLFTGDYNMKAGSPVPPAQGKVCRIIVSLFIYIYVLTPLLNLNLPRSIYVQGGFLVIRPSISRFKEFQSIIREGNHGNAGWEGSHIGNFWGGQTIQGIVPFFYHVKHPGDALELNRCVYNCMVDNPYRPHTETCLDGKPTCQDCRLQDPDLVTSAHFTICQKPWTCTEHLNPKNKVLCQIFHDKWFALRDELEIEMGVDLSYRAAKSRYENSKGMCKGFGDSRYIPIPLKTK